MKKKIFNIHDTYDRKNCRSSQAGCAGQNDHRTDVKAVQKNRSRAGFTLLETLLVVAILAVLFGVTLMSVTTFQKELRQKELDSKAEAIYMAAQNRIVELSAGGRADLYDPEKQSDITELGLIPVDSTDAERTADSLYYVISGAVGTGSLTTADILLPESRVEKELRDANWVIEFDPASGSVYAVFYSEKAMNYTPDAFDSLRVKQNRLKDGANVGYYGGDSVVTLDTTKLVPKIEIYNEEKLYGVISCASPDGGYLTFKITISDTFGNKVEKTIDHTQQKRVNKEWAYELMLDDLSSENKQFKNAYSKLVPGSDIMVSVTATSENDLVDEGTAEAKSNSLFAEVEKDGGVPSKAIITYCRHLQNLDESSGINANGNTDNTRITIKSATQKNNLHFENDEENIDDWYSCYGEGAYKAVKNKNLQSYNGSYTLSGESGNSTVRSIIYGLDTEKGMFDTFYGSQLLNITLSGAKIASNTGTIETGSAAGAIAAKLETSTSGIGAGTGTNGGITSMKGCQVYLDASQGDLTGKDEKDIWISGGNYIGGLIGHNDSQLMISDSFAATVAGTTGRFTNGYTGGLVGYTTKDIKIDDSYADCYLYGQNVGGLVGGASSESAEITVDNSYAVGYITATISAGGFTSQKAKKLTNSYAACSYTMGLQSGTGRTSGSSQKAYATAPSGSPAENVYYIPTSETIDSAGVAVSYKELSTKEDSAKKLGSSFTASTGGDNTIAYNLMKQGLTDYSFPRLKSLVHYGDWAADFESERPVYFEKYAGESYGIFGANLDTLAKSGKAVGDGYGIIYSEQPTKDVEVTYTAASVTGSTKRTATLSKDAAVEIQSEDKTYYLIPFTADITNTTFAPKNFYQPITIDGTEYYYNPHFAKTLTSEEPSKVANVIYVRTARQLYNMSLYYDTYADATAKSVYTQELNIDYTSYDWSVYYGKAKSISAQSPIGKGENYVFDATYDGSSNTITGISFENSKDGSYYAGMFGYNQGTLRNIAIVSEYEGSERVDRFVRVKHNLQGSKARSYIGVLAGRNAKTIRNCAVAGYTFKVYSYRNSTSYIGGLVGYSTGTIRECSAETPKMQLSATYATMSAGGFVGRNIGGIYSSYAIADIEMLESKAGTVAIAGFAAQNSGVINTAYCTSSVTASGSAEGYGFTPTGGTVTNCWYLNGGTYFYVEKLNAYNIAAGDTRTKEITGEELKKKAGETEVGKRFGLRFGKADESHYYKKTSSEKAVYPYPAVIRKGNKLVHYGNWIVEADLGETGVFYWEHEVGGANAGYHFRYIGVLTSGGTKDVTGVNGSSLCTSHDDGGVVKEFGYGYYVKKGGNVTATAGSGMQVGKTPNAEASEAISTQVKEYDVFAFTTGTQAELKAQGSPEDSFLYLTTTGSGRNAKAADNGTWTLSYKPGGSNQSMSYRFTVCPFFADAISYDGIINGTRVDKPTGTDAENFGQTDTTGSKNNPYQTRSAKQLQYINWNGYNCNATSAVVTTYGAANTYFPYLVYISGNNAATRDWNYYWDQTHDLDQQGNKNDKSTYFTPIGSMFYTTTDNKGQAYIAYFGGVYNGNAYAIKNIEIHSDTEMTGLFGMTAGAKLENIVMYSDKGNTIEITNKSTKWYSLGGLVGFAAKGTGTSAKNATITNCTVSGYKIVDSRSHDGGWGGASIGGLAGASNMDIKNCTAVNDIEINLTYNQVQYNNVRVGGLVGNLRGSVDSAYCGGSIVSNVKKAREDIAYNQNSTSIWIGGINGGIVMIDFGNIPTLIGSTTSEVIIKNSYTFVELPPINDHQVKCSQSIASIGEMQDYFAPIENPYVIVKNSYTYEGTAVNTDDYKTYGRTTSGWNSKDIVVHDQNVGGKRVRRYVRIINNNNKSPYVTYDQLSDHGSGGVKEWLNKGGGTFGFVTVTENGAKIDGKYSYPGNDASLEGNNYPFPTILTQTDTLGKKVSVHYGRWPKGSLYWSEAMVDFDLLEMDYIDGYPQFKMSLKYLLSGTGTPGTPDYIFMDEDGNELDAAEVIIQAKSSTYNRTDSLFNVIFNAIKTGTATIRAKIGNAYSDVLVNITAKLSLTADPAEINVTAGQKQEVSLKAESINKKKDFTKDVTWKIEVDDENIAECTAADYDADANIWKINVRGHAAGETRITATATYKMMIGGSEQKFTESTFLLVNVAEQNADENSASDDGMQPQSNREGASK